jgi:hypothetical protein
MAAMTGGQTVAALSEKKRISFAWRASVDASMRETASFVVNEGRTDIVNRP